MFPNAEIILKLEELEADESLCAEYNFDARADALEEIDFILTGAPTDQPPTADTENLLKCRAEKLKASLEAADNKLFPRLREIIKHESIRGSAFRDLVASFFGMEQFAGDEAGYDNLDMFLNRLIYDPVMPVPTQVPDHEMIFYQKTPARIVFQMGTYFRFSSGDHFVDIGSGLGQAVIIMQLLTGMPASGIEIEPAFCFYADACALPLGLNEIRFRNENAVTADYSTGTVFYLYTPFEGKMLQQLLGLLRMECHKREIKLFTYGPCSKRVAAESWLRLEKGTPDSAASLCFFKARALVL